MGCVSNVACKWLVQQQTLWFSLSLENKYRCNAVQFPEIRREAMIEGFPALVVKKFRLLCGLVPLLCTECTVVEIWLKMSHFKIKFLLLFCMQLQSNLKVIFLQKNYSKLGCWGNVSNIVEMCNDMQMLKNSPNVISAVLYTWGA